MASRFLAQVIGRMELVEMEQTGGKVCRVMHLLNFLLTPNLCLPLFSINIFEHLLSPQICTEK